MTITNMTNMHTSVRECPVSVSFNSRDVSHTPRRFLKIHSARPSRTHSKRVNSFLVRKSTEPSSRSFSISRKSSQHACEYGRKPSERRSGKTLPATLLEDNAVTEPPYYVKGSIQGGEVVEHTGAVVVLGDVDEQSSVIAGGDIIVWGRLQGQAHAGAGGNTEAVITALQLAPVKLKIGGITAQVSKNTAAIPETAFLETDAFTGVQAVRTKPYTTGNASAPREEESTPSPSYSAPHSYWAPPQRGFRSTKSTKSRFETWGLTPMTCAILAAVVLAVLFFAGVNCFPRATLGVLAKLHSIGVPAWVALLGAGCANAVVSILTGIFVKKRISRGELQSLVLPPESVTWAQPMAQVMGWAKGGTTVEPLPKPDESAAAAAVAAVGPAGPPDPRKFHLLPLPRTSKPVLVFVNSRSGGGSRIGSWMLRDLHRFLHPLQIVEISERGPKYALRLFIRTPGLRILVAGGDGSVSWVLQAMGEVMGEFEEFIPPPPIAMVPLGTGNDLGRALGWAQSRGLGLERGMPRVRKVLKDVKRASVALLDRWTVTAQVDKGCSEQGCADQRSLVMTNYLGIGVDAKVALGVHNMRETRPWLFFAQAINKVWYATLGVNEQLTGSCRRIQERLEIYVDDELLQIDADIGGVLVSNIPSFMGGVNVWGGAADASPADWPPQGMYDGKLEVIGIRDPFHLGGLQVAGALQVPGQTGLCLAQGSKIRIKTKERLPVQVDGEPWVQPSSEIEITHLHQAWMLRNERTSGRLSQVVQEVLSDTVTQGIIDGDQHRHILTEMAKRRDIL